MTGATGPGANGADPGGGAAPTVEGVTAVVLTHKRPRLAGEVTRALIDVEGFGPDRVVVVVNGSGGLDDPELESAVRTVRLDRNLGPAGGFRAGLVEAFADRATRWAYLCEDDVGLFSLPGPRVARLVGRVEAPPGNTRAADGTPVGAVVAYGRRFVGRGAHTVNVVPERDDPRAFFPVDVACWGATLVARSVVDTGVLPDPTWFFGLEDFDFFCRVRSAGFSVLLDVQAARQVAAEQTAEGRERALGRRRPTDRDEPWRAYYHARNSVALARRHGHPDWYAWHLLYSARHLQLASSRAERLAIAHGLWDGARGRMGEHPRYGRSLGELAPEPTPGQGRASPPED